MLGKIDRNKKILVLMAIIILLQIAIISAIVIGIKIKKETDKNDTSNIQSGVDKDNANVSEVNVSDDTEEENNTNNLDEEYAEDADEYDDMITSNISASKQEIEKNDDVTNEILNNLIEEIYVKYPELANTDLICSDGDNYWLLDKEGKKVYFYDLSSFEIALEKCSQYVQGTKEENIEFDLDKFITELGYTEGTSTVYDGVHGGDGYRQDSGFFNNISRQNFKVEQSGQSTIYSMVTTENNRGLGNYPIYLEIEVENNKYIKYIAIGCMPEKLNINGIQYCAREVLDAIGYTMYNKPIYRIIDPIESILLNKNLVAKNGDVLVRDFSESINTEYITTITFGVSGGFIGYLFEF